jgi:hypothetical protein
MRWWNVWGLSQPYINLWQLKCGMAAMGRTGRDGVEIDGNVFSGYN